MSFINFLSILDREEGLFSADVIIEMDPYIDPETEEVIEGFDWSITLDGVLESYGYSTLGYEYVMGAYYTALSPGIHFIEISATAYISGDTIELFVDLNNHIEAEFGQYIVGYNDTPNSNHIDVAYGSAWDDEFHLGQGDDFADGGEGNDYIDGGLGADWMRGGSGDDVYVRDSVADVIDESDGSGVDTVKTGIDIDLGDTAHFKGDLENVQLTGGADIDATGNELDNVIVGNSGANLLRGEGGRDYIAAGAGDDTVYGGDKGDFLFGNKGNDLIAPGSGADQIDGGLGLDRVWYGDSAGGVSVDLTTGTGARSDAAGDTYVGIERVTGSAFSDSIVGNALGNALKGGAGDDIIYGKDGRDVIEGQAGKDQLYGGAGNDNILGGEGNDKLFGNSGLDKLYGGAGNDQLTGGADADYFVFETQGTTGFGGDIVLDFQNGLDRLDMRGVYRTSDPGHAPIGFADLTIGAWNDGVKIVVQNNQIVYLDHAATGITVADIDAGDFLFA